MSYSSAIYPSKYLEIQFTSRRPKKYEVTLTGLRGYGIDYGIIELFTNQSVVCSENDLGQTVFGFIKEESKFMGGFNYKRKTNIK